MDRRGNFCNRPSFNKRNAEIATKGSSWIDQVVRQKPDAVLGLATGRTMENVYDKLCAKSLDFSQISSFNLDEYIGLSGDDPHSYRHYMEERLFSRINIDAANTHLPNGAADDIDAECAAYETKIEALGGIDLQLLGIGSTGHIGFNEPLSALRSRTRAKALTPATREQNQSMFASIDNVPKRAITMGVGTILDTRRCLLLATGTAKAEIIAKAVEGPVTSMISASALQLHPHCTIVVDEEAAAKLEQQEYYHWIFQNEPEWQEFQGL
jgi:glucosamine-6-phosphate deaminase